jgi:hypothetical protein
MVDDESNASTGVWSNDWVSRIQGRVRALGCTKFSDFLNMFPVESYDDIAKRLGDDVAPIQVIHLQLQESLDTSYQLAAGKDSLVRILNQRNRRGWATGLHWKRRMSQIYADWVTMAPMDARIPEISNIKKKVWSELENLSPPKGWVPKSIDDPIINEAFDKGWKT